MRALATAAGYGRCLSKGLARGFVVPTLAEAGTEVEIEILGQNRRARVVEESPYDPDKEMLWGYRHEREAKQGN